MVPYVVRLLIHIQTLHQKMVKYVPDDTDTKARICKKIRLTHIKAFRIAASSISKHI
jgi:hypothetical protein